MRAIAARHFAAISLTFFIYSAWAGLLGVAVVAAASPLLALAGLLASVVARVVADRAGAPRAFLDTGLIELNGWFVGLACGTFYAFGLGWCVAVVLGGTLALSIALHRVLATWDVPLLVGPYVPAFWVVWSALSSLTWTKTAALPTFSHGPSALWLVLLGGLRGMGQIFFLPNAAVGVALAVVASIGDRRLGPAMLLASMASVAIGYAVGTPAWQVEQGLAGFTPALLAAAYLRGFAGIGWVGVMVGVVLGPFLEAAALHLAGAVGVHALSATYVGLVWTFALVRPARESAAARTSWSMSSSSSRPRVFESV
jgi:urea transporter